MAEVGCAGILVADTFCGPMLQLPGEGELLPLDSMPSKAGGCAANVAICLAKQGIDAEVSGCLGTDPSAGILQASFEGSGVGCRQLVYVDGHPTSRTVILLVAGQDRRYLHVFGANEAYTVGHIDRDWVAGLKVFYLGGLFLMPAFRTDEFLDLLKFCRSRGVATVVDVVVPKGSDVAEELRTLLPYIDYFLPNDDEAGEITGRDDALAQLIALEDSGANTVVITRGAVGAVMAGGEDRWQMGAYEMQVIDPSGSGDAFAAGFIAGVLRGWDMPRTLRYAGALGASATQAVGTTDGVFTAADAESFLASHTLHVGRLE